MNDDAVLLREYSERRSQAAFAELVRRHVDMVYATALRRTDGDSHRAADATQQVFTTLAQKADRLQIEVLGAWLHTATRNAALNLMISEKRRQARERAAAALEPAAASAEVEWESIRPVLDDAIDGLPDPDRSAIVLRFLERKSFAAVGAVLRVSEDAARMRTERALEKLRSALSRRGITSTASALAAAVIAQPALAAPAGLATKLTAHALIATGAAVSPATASAGLSALMAKLVTTGAVGAVLAFGSVYAIKHASASAATPAPLTGSPPPDAMAPQRIPSDPPAGKSASKGAAPAITNWTADDLSRDVNLALNRGDRDFVDGQSVFKAAECGLCHRFNGGVGGIGPDLTGIGGKMDTPEIIRSIVEPSAVVSDLFGTVTVTTDDGRKYTGRPLTGTNVDYELVVSPSLNPATGTMSWTGPVVSIPNARITSAEPSGISPMPPALLNPFSKDEIIDLMAYLISAGNPNDKMFAPAR